jgi:integrase
MISLFKRGKIFWAQSTLGGIQRKWSLRTRDREIALELLRQAQLEQLSRPGHRPKRWEDFEKEFLEWIAPQVAAKTYSEYSRVTKSFGKFLIDRGALHMSDLSEELVLRFTQERGRSKHRINHRSMSPGGVRFEERILRRVFSYAVEQDLLTKNLIRGRNLNASTDKTQPFAPAEVEKMLGAEYLEGKAYLRAIVLLFLHTGLRIGDVIRLQRDSIQAGILHIKTEKRDVVVRLPLHSDVLAALTVHFAKQNFSQRKSSYVFSTVGGKPIVSLDKHLRRLWTACEISGGHAHRFRDTLAVRLLEQGASLYDVAKILGNSHQVVAKHYSPYVKELQDRNARLLGSLRYSAMA